MDSAPQCILALSCPNRRGIVAAVTTLLAQQGCDISESQQFDDALSGRFFMRVVFSSEEGQTATSLAARFGAVAAEFDMDWSLTDRALRPRALVMVSSLGHCLNDLLYRWSTGALSIDVAAVVSNHTNLETLACSAGIPFIHIPITRATRDEAERRLVALYDELGCDLIVLARYMQILSDDLCRRLPGRIINIHHSFLPSFKGAKPYHQAYRRGVKLIGATAHYVTPDLDEGPIIEQRVIRVGHAMNPDALVAAGRDVEAVALASAVQWHAERRVILNGSTTVVFR